MLKYRFAEEVEEIEDDGSKPHRPQIPHNNPTPS